MPGEEGAPLAAVKTGGVSLCVKIVIVALIGTVVVGSVITGVVVSQTGGSSSSTSLSSNQSATGSQTTADPVNTTTNDGATATTTTIANINNGNSNTTTSTGTQITQATVDPTTTLPGHVTGSTAGQPTSGGTNTGSVTTIPTTTNGNSVTNAPGQTTTAAANPNTSNVSPSSGGGNSTSSPGIVSNSTQNTSNASTPAPSVTDTTSRVNSIGTSAGPLATGGNTTLPDLTAAPSGNWNSTQNTTTTAPGTTATTTPRPTQPPRCFNGYTQTVIFLALDSSTEIGYPFLRGGYVTGPGESCPSACETPHCSVDIRYLDDNVTSAEYEGWRVREGRLDWEGAETDQGAVTLGKVATPMPALGTPLVKTTLGDPPLNNYGNNYYMVDLCVDCRNTTDNWLQLRAVWYNARDLSVNHEVNISQPIKCLGTAPVSERTRPSVSSSNHFARCGFVNVFDMNDNSCTIDYIVN